VYPFRNLLLQILSEAMSEVHDPYFNLPVAEHDPIKRERNYCAELYHQIRQRIDAIPYSITAEPNKKSHPVIEEHCGPVDPDLIIHHPGNFGPEDNLAVIEIKSADGNLNAGVSKDITTVNCMTSLEYGYRFGIFIVFGELSEQRRNNLIHRIQGSRTQNQKEYFLFLHHAAAVLPDIIQL
jgi:hypothetical protein